MAGHGEHQGDGDRLPRAQLAAQAGEQYPVRVRRAGAPGAGHGLLLPSPASRLAVMVAAVVRVRGVSVRRYRDQQADPVAGATA